MTHTWTRFVLTHRLLVAVIWLLATLAGAATVGGTVQHLTTSYTLPGHPGYVTDQRIADLYQGSGAQAPTIPVLTLPQGMTVHSPAARRGIADVFGAAAAVPGVRVADYLTTGDAAFVTKDGRSTFALVFTQGGAGKTVGHSDTAVETAVRTALPAGWHADVTGLRQLEYATPRTQGPGVVAESMIGALGAIIVLIFVFGSFLAVVPPLMAAASILTTFLLLRGLTTFTDVSFIAEYLVALIGLGVAIDYSLLVITRWREERSHGADDVTAVGIAMRRAGRSVAFSGLLVGIGLLSLTALPVPFLRSLGYAGLLIPLVSMLAATTLLPVLLVTVGPRLDWPHRRTELSASPRWNAWARLVVRRRWVAAATGVAVLAVLAVPLLSIQVGMPRASTLASSGTARDGLDTLVSGGVPAGILTPVSVLVRGSDTAALATDLASVNGVHDVIGSGAGGFHAHGTTLLYVLPTADAAGPAGQQTVDAVRGEVSHRPQVIGVGGLGAQMSDFDHAIYGNFWRMLLIIAVVTLIVLAVALRSIVLPIKAVLVNFASVAAAFGLLVLIWQKGYGSNLIWGVQATGTITFWVPIFVFAFVFGLSMDYEVFILTRVREEYDAGGSTDEAVVRGLARTGRLVSCAALILVLAFLAMSTAPQTATKILATGMGVGILVDAVVVRCLLVPALMALLGKWNWWLPFNARGAAGLPRPSSRETPAASAPTRSAPTLR